VKTTDNLIP